jgi:hypothetical protein
MSALPYVQRLTPLTDEVVVPLAAECRVPAVRPA